MRGLNRSNFARSGSLRRSSGRAPYPDPGRGFDNPLRAISDPLGLRGWIGCHWATLGLVLLIVVGAALRLAPIGANRFHEDEALYSFWALQIATGRDPILNHSRVDKPPLFIYTQALCFRLFGPSEVAARLPSELSSVASIALLYYLAWRLYGRAVAMAAAILMALSPFNILFAPTAFTDPMMVAWVLAALCLAVQGSLGWAGLALGLASATKQQGLIFVPLVVVIGIYRLTANLAQEKPGFSVPQRFPGCQKYPQLRAFGVPKTPKTWFLNVLAREGFFFALGFLAVMAPVAWWDSLRWRLQPNYFEQSLISYGGLALVYPAQLVERLGDWAEILHYMTASPFLNILLLGGLPCLLLYDLGWRRQDYSVFGLETSERRLSSRRRIEIKRTGLAKCPAWLRYGSPLRSKPTQPALSRRLNDPWRRGEPATFFDIVLSAFVILFLLGHWLLSFNIWDRYLLGLVPILLILLARVLWLASGVLARLLSPQRPLLQGLLTVALLAATLAGPAWVAAQSGYPIGGDHGAYDGIEAVADYFRERVPADSILYHHWLGWHYSFYMFDFPLVFRWYPSPEELAENARQVDDAQRYIVFPSGKSTAGARGALADAGLGLRSVYSAYGRDGSTSFIVYRIEDQK